MSKKITILENAVEKSVSKVAKIKTKLANGRDCYWVPEEDYPLGVLNVTEDGVYNASSDPNGPFYGYSEVNVDGVGNVEMGTLGTITITANGTYEAGTDSQGPFYGYSTVIVNVSDEDEQPDHISGKDPDGNDEVVTVDDDGHLVEETVPSSIKIISPPDILTYYDGELIDFHGIYVKGYLEDGTEWGVVPNDELSFPEPIAERDESESESSGFTARSDSLVFNAGTILSTNNGNRTPVTKKNDGFAACLLAINSSDPAGAYGGNWFLTTLMGPTRSSVEASCPNHYWSVQEFNINGYTVYVGGSATNEQWGGASIMSNPQDFPMVTGVPLFLTNRGYTEAHVRKMMEILSYLPGDGSGFMTVPVQWHRPGDGKSLYDSFEIAVNKPDDSGGQDPQPAPTPSPN